MDDDIRDDDVKLSSLVERIPPSDQMKIVEAGTSPTDLPPAEDQPKWRLFGTAKGEFTVPDDFNDPLPREIEDLFW